MAEAPLWAPWRMEYVLGPKPKGACIFCVDPAAAEDELAARLIVATTERAVVMMNRYPFAAGHLMVIPRRHASFLEELEADESRDLFDLVRESCTRLRRAVRCEGLNVGINLGAAAGAGIAEHLHVHVVPRWSGDTNFMPVIADTRVVPQALDATRAHLATHFADLAGAARPGRGAGG
jgi:ATP adenylyltransferase